MTGRPKAHAAAVVWFVMLAAAVSWPLILNLDTHVPGAGAGDNLSFLWNFWWFRYAIAEPDAPLFFTHHLFAPFGTPLVLHTHTALPALVGATLLGALPVVVSHNVVLLAGLAANGIAAYALAFDQTRRALPAVLAGTIVSASSLVSIRLLGHFNLVHAWVLPLVLLLWIRAADAPTPWRGAALGIALAAAAYTDYYYLVFAALSAAIWYAGRILRVAFGPPQPRALSRVLVAVMAAVGALAAAILLTGGFRFEAGGLSVSATSVRNPLAGVWLLALMWLALRIRVWVDPHALRPAVGTHGRALAAAAAVWTVAVLPLAIPAARLVASGDYSPPPHTWRSGPRGIDLATMALGNPLHPITGPATLAAYDRANIDVMEQTGWIGVVPLAVLGLLAVHRGRTTVAVRPWWALAVFFLVWSLGARLFVAGLDTGLPMPQALARFVPLLSDARMPGRAIVVVQAAAGVLCALAAVSRGWRAATMVGLIALTLADGLAAPIALYRLPRAGAVESALKAGGPQQAVLELPVGVRDGFGETGRLDHRALALQMTHERPLAGGFVARLSPRVKQGYAEMESLAALLSMSREPDRADPQRLPATLGRDLLAAGITHVVVNTDVMPAAIGEALMARGLRLVAAADARELYAVGGG